MDREMQEINLENYNKLQKKYCQLKIELAAMKIGLNEISRALGSCLTCKRECKGCQYYEPVEEKASDDKEKHGEWIVCNYGPYLYCECSECGFREEWSCVTLYCPRCGRKMEIEDEGEE